MEDLIDFQIFFFSFLEKRQKFDHGEDPLDPESQDEHGGPYWHQGFNSFASGGGFQFKFHFNWAWLPPLETKFFFIFSRWTLLL